MRTGMIIFGVIFLVIGGLLYFYPSQTVGAQTSTGIDVTNSSATLNTPVVWSYALLIIGGILLLLGLVIPGSVKAVQGPRGPRGRGPARYKRSSRISKKLPRGTTVTTTRVTRTRR